MPLDTFTTVLALSFLVVAELGGGGEVSRKRRKRAKFPTLDQTGNNTPSLSTPTYTLSSSVYSLP